jgi:hypothetical protein
VQKAKWEIESIVKDTGERRGGGRGGGGRGGRGRGRSGADWAAIRARGNKSIEQLQAFKPTKVHLGADTKDMVLNLLRYLATGMDTEATVAAVAGTGDGDDDDDSEDARKRRYGWQ